MEALQQLAAAPGALEFRRRRSFWSRCVPAVNGCSVCLDMHSREMKAAGGLTSRIAMVAVWRESPYFSDAERAALALTEAATRLADHPEGDLGRDLGRGGPPHDESQLAGLVLTIAGITPGTDQTHHPTDHRRMGGAVDSSPRARTAVAEQHPRQQHRRRGAA